MCGGFSCDNMVVGGIMKRSNLKKALVLANVFGAVLIMLILFVP